MFKRLLISLAAQGGQFAISLLDRVFVTAVLIRIWGVNEYSDWTAIGATVGIMAMADLGLIIYFGNAMQQAALVGNSSQFQRLVSISLYCYLLISAVLSLLLIGFTFGANIPASLGFAVLSQNTAQQILLLIGAYQISSFARSSISQIYRGKGEYGYGVFVALVPRALTSLFSVIVALAGGGVLLVSVTFVVLDVLAGWLFTIVNLRQRYPDVHYRILRPSWDEIRSIAAQTKWLAISANAPVAWLNVPVLIISFVALSGLPLVSFVVSRTIVNLGRQTGYLATIAVGTELNEDSIRGDHDLLRTRLSLFGRMMSILSGAAAGGLFILSPGLLYVWTDKAGLFDPVVMGMLLLQAFVVAPILPLTSLMMLGHAPRPPAIAHAVQILVGFVLGLVLAQTYGVRGLVVGLAIGEVIAQCGVFVLLARRHLHMPLGDYVIRCLAIGLVVGIWSMALAEAAVRFFGAMTIGAFALAGTAWVVLGLLPPLIYGMPRPQRHRLFAPLRRALAGTR